MTFEEEMLAFTKKIEAITAEVDRKKKERIAKLKKAYDLHFEGENIGCICSELYYRILKETIGDIVNVICDKNLKKDAVVFYDRTHEVEKWDVKVIEFEPQTLFNPFSVQINYTNQS